MVGGVNSPVRSFKGVGGNPLVMKYAKGSKLYDQDHNEYTDYCLSWGAQILGHANRNVILAAKKTAERGVSFGTTTQAEIDLAEIIAQLTPAIEQVRFVNSGTEATMSAIRLSRGFTKRDKIIKFDGCYHGHVDDLLTKAGSGVALLNETSSAGIPLTHTSNTISLPYNNSQVFQQVIEENKEHIACVIIEPVAGNMGVIKADLEFLKVLRKLTAQHKIVLIFDEIMSGFRSGVKSVQGEVQITPDLTCLGKIIGGGFPMGAYGGRTDIMSCLAPLGDVYQAGTFSGTPVIMRAGYATVRQLNTSFYKSLNTKCDRFALKLNEYFKQNNIPAHLCQYASMMSLRFRKEPVYNYQDALEASSSKIYSELFHHLISQGIYFPPADLEAFFISGKHSKRDLDHLYESLIAFFSG